MKPETPIKKGWWQSLKERLTGARPAGPPNGAAGQPDSRPKAHRTTAFFELP
jgi:hypothetical protein